MTQADLMQLLLTIAPHDLTDRPLYVTLASALPTRLHPPIGVAGWAADGMDLSLRDALAQLGEWRGRGRAMVLNDVAFVADMQADAGDAPALVSRLVADRLLAVALHEAGHLLPVQGDFSEPRTVASYGLAAASLAGHCTRPTPNLPSQLAHHDARFIRRLAHLIHRAEQAGAGPVVRNLAFTGANYELSSLVSYEAALTGELESYRGTFAELETTRPPDGFVELWRSDLFRLKDTIQAYRELEGDVAAGLTLFSEN